MHEMLCIYYTGAIVASDIEESSARVTMIRWSSCLKCVMEARIVSCCIVSMQQTDITINNAAYTGVNRHLYGGTLHETSVLAHHSCPLLSLSRANPKYSHSDRGHCNRLHIDLGYLRCGTSIHVTMTAEVILPCRKTTGCWIQLLNIIAFFGQSGPRERY